MSSPTSGWLVLQKQTSQAFDAGLLLKTMDAGLTWKSYSLPTASQIQFHTDTEGWLVDRLGKAEYHTRDGGATWQPSPDGQSQLSSPPVPENTLLSGWQADGLGWAITSSGTCNGDKTGPAFACLVENHLWQSLDDGQTWHPVSLPGTGQTNR
jgi:hypothetical protein